MGLVTGTGLQNGSEVIDTVRSTLVSEGWTEARNTGTVGANNKEVWLHKAAAATVNGIDMLVGLRMINADTLQVMMSHLTPSQARVSGVSPINSFARVLGTPNNSLTGGPTGTGSPVGNSGDVYQGVTLTSNQDSNGGRSNLWNQGANYLRHWIFTTPTSSPIKEQYCYVVVEVATGLYRTIAFGEGVKLGGSAWEGGLFFDATFNEALFARTVYALDGGYQRNPFDDSNQGGWALNFSNPQYTQSSPLLWNPWVKLGYPLASDASGLIGMGDRCMGADFIDQSPAAFSGQSIRIPARFYQLNVLNNVAPPRVRPLFECPDYFITNIEDLTPGATVVDDADKFLVVPLSAKTGSNSSGNRGALIRNPLL